MPLERLWAKPPTADLLDGVPGRTDEDELGLTYPQIDDYLEGKEIDEAATRKLDGFTCVAAKRTTPVTILIPGGRTSFTAVKLT